MESLYNISNELLSIFNEIESNDGEVTEEQLELLDITKDKLDEKLISYKKAIRCWEADVDACKQEEKRIKAARQVKENRISKLKDRMLYAVQQFGFDGKPNKSGKSNKLYELSDGRIFTKSTESVELNEHRLDIFNRLLPVVCSESFIVDIIGNPRIKVDVLNLLNEQLHTYFEGEPDFTINDLENIKIQFTDNIDIVDLILRYSHLVKNIGVCEDSFTTKVDVDKQFLKLMLNDPDKEITIAGLKETQSIIIK